MKSASSVRTWQPPLQVYIKLDVVLRFVMMVGRVLVLWLASRDSGRKVMCTATQKT